MAEQRRRITFAAIFNWTALPVACVGSVALDVATGPDYFGSVESTAAMIFALGAGVLCGPLLSLALARREARRG